MSERPAFSTWAADHLYLHDRRDTRAVYPVSHARILDHLFPAGKGPLPYSRIVWSCPKKSAKSTLAAGLHLWFARYIGVPGEQYALANDLDGAKSRVWRYAVASMKRDPDTEPGYKIAGETITFGNQATLRAIPSDYRGEAGSNFSLATVDEPWGIIHEGGVRLMTEFSPVPTRDVSVVFYTGYAGFTGQSEFWHGLIDAGLAGEPVPALRDLENGDGEPACWHNGGLFVYLDHQARMPWHTPAFLEEQRRALPRSEYLRVWENRRTHSADALVEPAAWDALRDPGLAPLRPGDTRPIVLAADAAIKADCTALVGCAWTGRAEAIFCQTWEPAPGAPLALTETLAPAILRLCAENRIAAVLYDPYQMAAVAEICRRAGAPMVEFPQTAARVRADTHLKQLIDGGRLAHTGQPELRAHVLNAVCHFGERGLRIAKPTFGGKVDAAVALSMAALGASERLDVPAAVAKPLRAARNPFFP